MGIWPNWDKKTYKTRFREWNDETMCFLKSTATRQTMFHIQNTPPAFTIDLVQTKLIDGEFITLICDVQDNKGVRKLCVELEQAAPNQAPHIVAAHWIGSSEDAIGFVTECYADVYPVFERAVADIFRDYARSQA